MLVAMSARALADLHDLVAGLNPTALHDLGLVPALETLALRIKRRYGLAVTLDLLPGLPDSATSLTEPASVLPLSPSSPVGPARRAGC